MSAHACLSDTGAAPGAATVSAARAGLAGRPCGTLREATAPGVSRCGLPGPADPGLRVFVPGTHP